MLLVEDIIYHFFLKLKHMDETQPIYSHFYWSQVLILLQLTIVFKYFFQLYVKYDYRYIWITLMKWRQTCQQTNSCNKPYVQRVNIFWRLIRFENIGGKGRKSKPSMLMTFILGSLGCASFSKEHIIDINQ